MTREEGLHVRTVDTQIDMIVEFPLAVVVDNLIQARRGVASTRSPVSCSRFPT
jgi:hypothetical protein